MKKIFFFSFCFFWLGVSLLAHAQVAGAIEDAPISRPILIVFIFFIMSMAPFLLMMTTSFVKMSVVLSLVRSALGTQQIPPNQIVTGLALILTIYVMMPVAQQVYDATSTVIHVDDKDQTLLSNASLGMFKQALEVGREPVREFLLRHSHDKERKLFFGLAQKLRAKTPTTAEIGDKDFIVLIPSFVISELSGAFQIGFVIFLPFLVIDMVVSNILLSMGMFQLSPITISLPFKLLLFVLVDGWYMITKGLVSGYIN